MHSGSLFPKCGVHGIVLHNVQDHIELDLVHPQTAPDHLISQTPLQTLRHFFSIRAPSNPEMVRLKVSHPADRILLNPDFQW